VSDRRFCFAWPDSGCTKKKISYGCATADSVVTHCKDFSVSILSRPFVKLESFSIEPARARLLVVLKRKPEPLKLSGLLVVCVSHEVDDVGDAQCL